MARGDNHGVNFVFELYEEDDTLPPFLELLLPTDWPYAYILHDKDLGQDGQPVKNHYHAIVHTDNDRSLASVSDKLGVELRFVQVLRKGDELGDCKSYLRYMLHWDSKSRNEGKHKYELDELIGPLKDKYLSALTSRRSSAENPEDALKLLDFISSHDEYLSMEALMRFAISNGLYSLLRRSASLFRSVLVDHNADLRTQIIREGFSEDVMQYRSIRDAYYYTRHKVESAGGNPDNVRVNLKLLQDALNNYKEQ